MNVYKKNKNYTWIGTSERHSTKVANTLIDATNNPTICAAPDKSWQHSTDIMLSYSNSKVRKFGKTQGTKAAAYGKTTILSCPFAGSCIRFCYQNTNNYSASKRMHGNNYYHVYSRTAAQITVTLQAAINNLKAGTGIIRLNDNGDFMSLQEVQAFLTIADNNPQIVFYGYTKASAYIYKARQARQAPFPSNFRIALSDLSENDSVSEKFTALLRTEYPNEFYICYIIDTPERDKLYAELPWNNEELQCYTYSSDFKIALHIKSNQRKFCTAAELQIVDKYSAGHSSDGIAYC